jgi:hypothetical protein
MLFLPFLDERFTVTFDRTIDSKVSQLRDVLTRPGKSGACTFLYAHAKADRNGCTRSDGYTEKCCAA